MSTIEFDIFPRRGYVRPGDSVQIQLYFEPTSETKFQTNLRVLWEGIVKLNAGKSLKMRITGTGGVGHIEIGYSSESDKLNKCLDFGMVPYNTSCEKKFYLMNYGQVGVYAFSVVENEDYNIALFGEIFYLQDISNHKSKASRSLAGWEQEVGIYLPPNMAIEMVVRYLARSTTNAMGDVSIRSEAGSFVVPLRGKGGTISLSHESDLDFGYIACNYTFVRKLKIINGGSIPSQLKCGWLVVGGSSCENSQPLILLNEQFTSLDPRSY
jgi:hypothetical protein